MPASRKTDPVLLLFAAAVLAVSVQKGVVIILAHAGNFLLFRTTFHRLVSGADIYNPPAGEMTGFLYSPTFALLFAPFAVLPLGLALLLWNAVNALALYWGITRLLSPAPARVALLIVFVDLVRSLQNSQSNALVAGLMVLAFLALERERVASVALGAAAILTGGFIKIYPLAAGVLGLIRPRRVRFLGVCLVVGAVLVALPLLVQSPPVFIATYREWFALTQRDTALQGQSIMRFLSAVSGTHVPTEPIQVIGVLLLLAPLASRRESWSDAQFRMRWLCSLLVFCVIFNHQAESPSFIVASTGVAIWFVSGAPSWGRVTLLALVLALDSLPHLFFVPAGIYKHVIGPLALDAIPCLLVWVVIQYELWTWPRSRDQQQISSPEALANLS